MVLKSNFLHGCSSISVKKFVKTFRHSQQLWCYKMEQHLKVIHLANQNPLLVKWFLTPALLGMSAVEYLPQHLDFSKRKSFKSVDFVYHLDK